VRDSMEPNTNTVSESATVTPPTAVDVDAPPAERVLTTVSRIVRDTALANRVKGLHRQRCQICGETVQLADGTDYAEGHHLQPLGEPHNGPDLAENIVCLCPNHHAACDFGAILISAPDLRTADGHAVAQRFLDYHNRTVYRGSRPGHQGE
jgi:predicted restriction endonuclease